MASFSNDQWEKVFQLLDQSPTLFGFPEKRNDSVVLSSFNIRKIGRVESKSIQSWQFLERYCKQCDLIAVQEVQDNLDGMRHLKSLLGDGYGMVASDITGKTPGAQKGMAERMAFLFRWSTVERTEVASDISYDRSDILNNLYENRGDFTKALEDRTAQLADWKAKNKRGTPPFVLPRFLTFIRTPYCVSFRVSGLGSAAPYEFLAVNAHLLYGDKSKQAQEREMEFEALIRWLIARAKQADNMYHPNIILFGDLNLDFKEADGRREEIEQKIKDYNKKYLRSKKAARVNFPFLNAHPDMNDVVFRTNVRLSETFDQIGLFAHDKRLPDYKQNLLAGKVPGKFNYGMFNFVDLFAKAIHGKTLAGLTKNQRKSFFKKFEHDVSDHMPIWIRLPKPYADQPEF